MLAARVAAGVENEVKMKLVAKVKLYLDMVIYELELYLYLSNHILSHTLDNK